MKISLKISPHRHLLQDNQFVLWLENVERGSIITAAEYFRRIGHICKTFEMTTQKLASLSEKESDNFLFQVISHFERKKAGHQHQWICQGLKVLVGPLTILRSGKNLGV